MNQANSEYLTDLEKDTAFYVTKIQQIDRLLQGPVETLSWVATQPWKKGQFPAFISDHTEPQQALNPSTEALCLATLWRLKRLQRRFPGLIPGRKLHELVDEARKQLEDRFLPREGDPDHIQRSIQMLRSAAFGGLNPLTASHVERVLVETGEAQAHRGIGFLCFFAMVWPLFRHFPNSLDAGARLEPWEPTAYVTANCLHRTLAIKGIATRRAEALEAIAHNLKHLSSQVQPANKDDRGAQWFFSVQLDQLSANLARLAILAIDRDAVNKCVKTIEKTSAEQTVDGEFDHAFRNVTNEVRDAIVAIGSKTKTTIEESKQLLEFLGDKLVKPLGDLGQPGVDWSGALPPTRDLEDRWGLRFVNEYLEDVKRRADYLADLASSASDCLTFCQEVYEKLEEASQACLRLSKTEPADINELVETLISLARANKDVAGKLQAKIEKAAEWCRSILTREIAQASAGNVSEFDASELISAMSVATRCQLLNSDQEVRDAVAKALLGTEPDGSWKAGRPFYSPDNEFGIWPETSDIVWTLTQAIEQHPDVRVADESLFRYLDWLERTQTQVRPRAVKKDGLAQPLKGWPSDRLQHRRKIHLDTTTFTVNALLEIRDLVEYRLWQLCQRRFSAIPVFRGLTKVDPVDLGAQHGSRLHSHLARLARSAQIGDGDAEYSLILHGPPGSSKTEVAKALAWEAWKDSSRWGKKDVRYVRITPADFTRLGEDRVDSEARLIFELLSHARALTIHFDEIDDLLRRRGAAKESLAFMDLVVPAMLNRLADLRDACPSQEICFLLSTNYVEKIEPALIRKGRIDRPMAVVYPDADSRLAILWRHARTLGFDAAQPDLHETYLSATRNWPWKAIDTALREFIPDGKEKLTDILARHSADLVEVEYDDRWHPGRKSRQLVEEYVRYLIAGYANVKKESAPELKVPIDRLMKLWGWSLTDLLGHIGNICGKEGRVIQKDLLEQLLTQPP
jgi:hypothetical protein